MLDINPSPPISAVSAVAQSCSPRGDSSKIGAVSGVRLHDLHPPPLAAVLPNIVWNCKPQVVGDHRVPERPDPDPDGQNWPQAHPPHRRTTTGSGSQSKDSRSGGWRYPLPRAPRRHVEILITAKRRRIMRVWPILGSGVGDRSVPNPGPTLSFADFLRPASLHSNKRACLRLKYCRSASTSIPGSRPHPVVRVF